MNTAAVASSPAQADPWAAAALDAMLARCLAEALPREPLTIIEWAERYRTLSSEENPDYAGAYSLDNTPALRGILAACGDPTVRRVVVQKSAQLGYTAGVVCNVLGYHAHWKPCVQVVMFPREKSAKDFDAEKFSPMVRATPMLAERIRLKSRSDGNSATRKKYPGGLIKLVASNSPSDVKSTTAKVRIVEEPDDTNKDVRGQGNSIALLRERGKAIRDGLELIGGSPTAKGASEIEKEIRTTDQRRFMVACHDCGERHQVEWENVHIPGDDLTPDDLAAPDIDARWPVRDVYGRARFEDAYYTCPHCGSVWTDEQRVANIRSSAVEPPLFGWEPSATNDDPGFFCNELQSIFEGSYVPVLAEKYLRAKHMLERGDPTEMVTFTNATRGKVWEYRGELPEEDELRERAAKYPEWTVPAGGLVPLMFVDVQHDRLAVTVWVIGRGEEMWLAWWGELPGRTIIEHSGAWVALEELMNRPVRHVSGAALPIAKVGIDSGDGQTSDAVYAFVRKHNTRGRPVVATKGASERVGRVEIWTKPKPIDPNRKATKASKYGVHVHTIGAAKAKDLILGWATEGGRVRLEGSGPGRMHWFETVRPDFYEQLLGEMKVPNPQNPRLRVWTERTDRRNEVLDCTVGCLWLSRSLQLHTRKPAQWEQLEHALLQGSLLDDAQPDDEAAAATPTPPRPPTDAMPIVHTSAPPPAAPRPVPPPARTPVMNLGGTVSLSGMARFRAR